MSFFSFFVCLFVFGDSLCGVKRGDFRVGCGLDWDK